MFQGSEDDVLGRVTKAINFFKTDIVVQITGDNPLVDKNLTEELILFFLKIKISMTLYVQMRVYIIRNSKRNILWD